MICLIWSHTLRKRVYPLLTLPDCEHQEKHKENQTQSLHVWVPVSFPDTAVDRLMLHLYRISTTGEESVVLCPNHNNKVSLNDGSLRAEVQDYQLTQLSQNLQLLENLRFLLGHFTKNHTVIFCQCAKHFFLIIQPALWFRDTNTLYCSPTKTSKWNRDILWYCTYIDPYGWTEG